MGVLQDTFTLQGSMILVTQITAFHFMFFNFKDIL